VNRIRVALVDDHHVVREGFRATLEHAEDMEIVGEAGEAEEAVSLVARLKPDVVLLDLQVPGASGPELCWRVSEASPESAVVVLTAFLNPHLLKACLLGGIRGYLLKDAAHLDLAAAVRTAHSGDTVFDPRATNMVASFIREANAHDALTRRELQVLRLMSKGLTNKEIGERLFISLNTVKGHVAEIMVKLGSRNRVEATAEARARNLI